MVVGVKILWAMIIKLIKIYRPKEVLTSLQLCELGLQLIEH